ncbi:MAG: hypothetical protein EA352_12085 [Gemmatimonadales bacterium]|nr:MAG: hypothetical protein EA352_12085 [Gemmatimonadales bacterium]
MAACRIRNRVFLLATLALFGSLAVGCENPSATPSVTASGDEPLPASALTLADGVILSGGFDALLDDPPEFGMREVSTIPSAEARTRWGDAAEDGARLLARDDAPPADASLRQVLQHHGDLLEAMAALEDPPQSRIFIGHGPPLDGPPLTRILLVVEGEICCRLMEDPPADSLHHTENEPSEKWEIRSVRGDSAATLYGIMAWFGVVQLTRVGPVP